MAGNAYEWTRDLYTVSYYLTLANTTADPCMEDESMLIAEDKLGGSDGDMDGDGVGQATKIIRGGSWYSQKSSARTFPRSETRAPGSSGFHSVGFRVVATNPMRDSKEPALSSGGAGTMSTAGNGTSAQTGYALGTVTSGAPPYAVAIFSYKQDDVVVSEAAVPPSPPTTSARIFVDCRAGAAAGPGSINTGLALVNRGSATAKVAYTLRNRAGAVLAAGNGTIFTELISGLPADFKGVLDIASASPFAALTLRSLVNSRGNFLLTAFPVADATQPAPNPIVFPQIADGGGYVTEFILLSPGAASNTTLSFYGEDGTPLAIAN